MSGGIEQLMVGGSKPLFAGQSGLYMHNESIGGQAHRSQWDVRSVDTVRWIQHNVRPEEPFDSQLWTSTESSSPHKPVSEQDFFVLKMDIEGFEHKLIPSMLEARAPALVGAHGAARGVMLVSGCGGGGGGGGAPRGWGGRRAS